MEGFQQLLPYIEGKSFAEQLRMKVTQNDNVPDRIQFIEDLVRGQKVIHVGCLDHLPSIAGRIQSDRWFHGRLTNAASECLGIDNCKEGVDFVQSKLGILNICAHDLESKHKLELITSRQWNYAIFGEVLEHVDNPVNFLQKFISDYKNNVERIILTVPNAFRGGNIKAIFQNFEVNNSDHRYWFSPYTAWKVAYQAGLDVEVIKMCQFSWLDGTKGKFKNLILRRFPLLAEDIVLIGRPDNSNRLDEKERE